VNGVDAVSRWFVEGAGDIEAVRSAATAVGRQPFIIARIERAGALKHFDEVLEAAGGEDTVNGGVDEL
jgi:pyruvate kinase